MGTVTPSPELVVAVSGDVLEIRSPMPVGKRVLLFLLALVPLLAPYELLVKPRWNGTASAFFLMAALVSLGAVGVSLLFAWGAVAGLRSSLIFDRARGRLTHTAWAPVMGRRTSRCALGAIAALEVETHEWSDGAPTYSLKVATVDRRVFSTSSSTSRDEVEVLRQRVAAFLSV